MYHSRSQYPRNHRPDQVPTWPVELNGAHPLVSGLVCCYIPTATNAELCGYGPSLLPNGKMLSTPAGPAVADMPVGRYPLPPIWLSSSTGISLHCRGGAIAPPSRDAEAFGLIDGSHEDKTFYTMGFGYGDNVYFSANNGTDTGDTGIYVNTESGIGTAGIFTLSASFVVGGNCNIWYRAANILSLPWTGTAPAYSTDGYVIINRTSTTYTDVNFGIQQALIYLPELTADQIAWLDKEPFAMLQPIIRRSYHFTTPEQDIGTPQWPIITWIE